MLKVYIAITAIPKIIPKTAITLERPLLPCLIPDIPITIAAGAVMGNRNPAAPAARASMAGSDADVLT